MRIYRRPGSPNWWYQFAIAGVTTRKTAGTTVKSDAEELMQREWNRQWRLHKLGDKSAVQWNDVAARWMRETTKRSKDMDEMILKWLAPRLDDEPVSYLDRDVIEVLRKQCLDDGEKQRSPATVDRYMCLVRSILNACVNEWRILDRAPKVPMFSPPKKEPRWLTREEWKRLERELPDHLRLAAHFAILTGLRMRAMLARRKSIEVTLPAAVIERLRALGDGNVSRGIERAEARAARSAGDGND